MNKLQANLSSLHTIRTQARRMLALARQNKLNCFSLHEDKLADTATFVVDVIRDQYPSLNIPSHTRWRHFEAGGVDRMQKIYDQIASYPAEEQGRILTELVIISVFLDAGAGDDWQYKEANTGLVLTRSEGLGVACLTLYQQGAFSADPSQPMRVDSSALQKFTRQDLITGFQVQSDNPLAGLDGRVALLNRLGASLAKSEQIFGQNGRLGHFYDYLLGFQQNGILQATELFQAVLTAFTDIWPKRLQTDDIPLGDVWIHPALQTDNHGSQYIPFHKLSQWLSYSLIESMEHMGVIVKGQSELTGLAEYRNGGLLVDMGVLEVKNSSMTNDLLDPGSECVVEWRALTIALLDELAEQIRSLLNKDATELPLAKILQGGTWEAGRRIARKKRKNGGPPLGINSDGTVF